MLKRTIALIGKLEFKGGRNGEVLGQFEIS